MITTNPRPPAHELPVPEQQLPVGALPALVGVLPMNVGRWVLERMVAEGLDVGPVVVCERHRKVRIPLHPDTANSPAAERLELSWSLACDSTVDGCRDWDWLLPPRGAQVSILTDYLGLCDSLQCVLRNRPRRAA